MKREMVDKICEKTVEAFGAEAQFNILEEECSELIQTICHRRRNKATIYELIDECVDVELCIIQVQNIMKENQDYWKQIEDFKLNRLIAMIEQKGIQVNTNL